MKNQFYVYFVISDCFQHNSSSLEACGDESNSMLTLSLPTVFNRISNSLQTSDNETFYVYFAAQLVEHLVKYNLFDRFQSACRPEHSTETAALRILNDVLCNVDDGDFVLLALNDLSAAFDTIYHCIFLQRLHN